MTNNQANNEIKGAALVAGSYFLWGVLPVYWKILKHVPSLELLCHRIVWCLLFMFVLIILRRQFAGFKEDIKCIIAQPRKMAGVIFSAIFLNMNWGIYIWAVNHNHLVQTSLGYYINPLVSVLLGMMVLKERLNRWQYAAFFIALAGVLYLTFNFGSVPWIALTLAITFGLYGLLKKTVGAGAITGLTLETMIMVLPALYYLLTLQHQGVAAFTLADPTTAALLALSGVVTGVPLLLFASGALRLSLTVVGFLQYISPTLSLLLGIFLYHETFTVVHLISFALIWTALIIFTLAQSGILKPEKKKTLQRM